MGCGCTGGRFCATVAVAGDVRNIGLEWCRICTAGAGVPFGLGAEAVFSGNGVAFGSGVPSGPVGAAGVASGTGAGAGTALAMGAGAGFGRWVNFMMKAPPNAPTSTRSPI